MKTIRTYSLKNTIGNSNKFYKILVRQSADNSFSVLAKYGRRSPRFGASGGIESHKGENLTLIEAMKIVNRLLNQKYMKGYVDSE